MLKNCIQKQDLLVKVFKNQKRLGTRPAKGMKGIILLTFNNQYVFRVYKEDNSFTDYGIHHCDLDVTIDSDDAVLYEYEDGRNTLDHSYEVLGISHLTDKGYELGTEEGLKEFVKQRNKI